MTWSPPSEIGEYRLGRPIGEGGMGQVWLAQDVALGRRVALKFPTGLDGPRAEDRRARFVLEGQALARVSHPNILAVFHAGLIEHHPYLVTEYIAGSPLASLPLPFSSAELLEVGTQLARALAAVHRAGVLHRDISPANVVRTKLGKIKLIDFGLATQPNPAAAVAQNEDGTTAMHQTVGAAAYLAPEIWMNDPSSRLSDIYALGATLFHLATGRPPFVASSIDKLWMQVMSRPVPPVRSIAKDLPHDLAELIDRCLERDPVERMQSAEELAAGLDALARVRSTVPQRLDTPPYRGLDPYEEEHRDDFFGREQEIALVLERLKESGFAALIGSSGSGKTSLLRAGLIPAVAEGAIDGNPTSTYYLRPKREPISALIKIAGASGDGIDVAVEAIRRAVKPKPLLLVLDQIEEALNDPTAAAELGLLLERLVIVGPDLKILVGLRSDAVSQLDAIGVMRSAVVNNAIVLGPLRREALKRAVLAPLERRGYRLDPPALLDRLVSRAESLPLLSFALSKLWLERDQTRQVLSEATLDRIGGIEGALAQHAEEAFARLPQELEAQASSILVGLALGDGDPPALHSGALAALIKERLVVAKEDHVALAHPFLAEGWGRLRAWIDREAASRAVRARLRRAATEWDRIGRRNEELWRGRRLESLRREGLSQLDDLEREFIEASVRAERKETFARWRQRIGLLALVFVMLLGTLVAWRVDAMREAEKVILARIARGRELLDAAERIGEEAREQKQRAFEAFDRGDNTQAEELWATTLETERRVNNAFLEASEEIETALAVAPDAPPIRDIAAEAYFEWLGAAERSHQTALVRELKTRLEDVDDRGFLQRLVAPATLRLSGAPVGAAGQLFRIEIDRDGRRRAVRPQPAVRLQTVEPGAYLLVAHKEGWNPTIFSLYLEPAEFQRAQASMLLPSQVPSGFIHVPGGSGLIGSTAHEVARKALGAQPQHRTQVEPFLIQETETTLGQYVEFLGSIAPEERGRRRPRAAAYSLSPDLRQLFTGSSTITLSQPFCPENSCEDPLRWPVAGISYADAAAYAAWLTKTNRVPNARLCRSREWERAARGADGRLYPSGEQLHPGDANVKIAGGFGRVTEVGRFEFDVGPFGAKDMAGNVFEWVVAGPLDAPRAALRGGAYDVPPDLAQSSAEGPAGDNFHATVGFRVCADVIASTKGSPG